MGMGIDRNTVERSRGTARHTRAVVVVVSVGRDFRLTAGSRGAGGLRGAGGHSLGSRILQSLDVGVDGSFFSSAAAAFVLSSAAADSCVDDAGDGEAEAASAGSEGAKGAVLIGGSDARPWPAEEAIAVGRIGGGNSRRAREWVRNGIEFLFSGGGCKGKKWVKKRNTGKREVGEDGPPDGAGPGAGDSGVGRARSLTDDDLEELKGCVDLGFGFSYNEIPELCGTLPALELCYSMSQRFLDEHQPSSKAEDLAPEPPAVVPPSPVQPIPNWKISCPGDSPDEVKARLKYWAQAVACTVKLCS